MRPLPKEANWRLILYGLASLEFYGLHQEEKALLLIEESIKFDPTIFDATSYLFLDELLIKKTASSEVLIKAKKMYEGLRADAHFPGIEKFKAVVGYSVNNHIAILKTRNDFELLLLAHKLFPTYSSLAMQLSTYYLKEEHDPYKATQVLLDTLKLNPFTSRTNIVKLILEIASNQNRDNYSRGMAQKYIDEINQKFPSEKYLLSPMEDKILYDWIFWGMDQIINKFQKLRIKLVIQNYHWIRDRTEADILYKVNADVARTRNIPFIDLHSEYQATVINDSDIESYFVQTYGQNDSHPSEKGHKLIAYILYKNLVQQKLLPNELSHFNPEEILN